MNLMGRMLVPNPLLTYIIVFSISSCPETYFLYLVGRGTNIGPVSGSTICPPCVFGKY